jgi:hypothetical protein
MPTETGSGEVIGEKIATQCLAPTSSWLRSKRHHRDAQKVSASAPLRLRSRLGNSIFLRAYARNREASKGLPSSAIGAPHTGTFDSSTYHYELIASSLSGGACACLTVLACGARSLLTRFGPSRFSEGSDTLTGLSNAKSRETCDRHLGIRGASSRRRKAIGMA